MSRTGKKLIAEFPEVVKHCDYIKNKDINLNTITYGSRKKVYWKCPKCGKEDFCTISGKVTKYKRSSLCRCNFNNLLTKQFPGIYEHWDYKKNKGIDLATITYGSPKKVHCICTICKLSYSCIVANMVTAYKKYKTTGCPYCHGKENIMVNKRLYEVAFSEDFIYQHNRHKPTDNIK